MNGKLKSANREWKAWHGGNEVILPDGSAWWITCGGERRAVKPCVGVSYFALIVACYAGMAILLFLLRQTSGGAMEPFPAGIFLESQPAWLRGLFFATALALVAVMVDFTGRFGASVIFDMRHVARVSARRWALYRLAVLASVLLPLGLCLHAAPDAIPYLHGRIGTAFAIALAAPAALAAFDCHRARDFS